VDHLVRALKDAYDYVIIDAGSTLLAPTAAALQLSDSIMLVANPDVPCLRNLQRIIDAVKAAGVSGERLRIILNRASEFGVLSTVQIERVLGFAIAHSVASDYRTVASAVNAGVPVSALKATELNSQLDAIARALARVPERPRRPERSVADESEDGVRRNSGVRVPGSEFRVP
jgi:Flp pilus assembly CpaE family ATPase